MKGSAGLFLNFIFMSDPTKYNRFGQEQTGFRSGIENSMFGHWSNPEYSQMLQDEERPIPLSGVCQCCGEKWEDDFWANEEKTLCLNCYTPTPDDYLPY